jgi:hypothetical protein
MTTCRAAVTLALLSALACSAHALEGPSRRLLLSAWTMNDPVQIVSTILDTGAFKLIRPRDIKITKPKPEVSGGVELNGLGAIELSRSCKQ